MGTKKINEGLYVDPEYKIEDEYASLSGFTHQTQRVVVREPTMDDIKRYLRNPYAQLNKIRETSAYLTNKHGIIKDVLRMFRSMPTLKYRLGWGFSPEQHANKENNQKVQDFLDRINVVEFVRDGMWETAEQGTVVTVLRNESYVQFLPLEELRINKQTNGKWDVEYDLINLNQYDTKELKRRIESLPDEVTLSKYIRYRKGASKDKDEENRYVKIKNSHVVKMDGKRNMPYGLPLTMGAWTAILQKEIISNTERSVADRIIKQILVVQGGYYDAEKKQPIKIGTLRRYFEEITKAMQSQESSGSKGSSTGGIATLAIPHYLGLDTLDVNTKLFEKELYDKINNDIYENLGVSPALVAGLEGNYASANANNEKFFSFIASTIEKFEAVVNDYIALIVDGEQGHDITFERATVLDKQAEIDRNKEFYMQTGNPKPWIESLYGSGSFEPILEQTRYQKEVLKIEEVFYPAQNAHTSSGDITKQQNPNNDNTDKNNTNNGNETPSPVDRKG